MIAQLGVRLGAARPHRVVVVVERRRALIDGRRRRTSVTSTAGAPGSIASVSRRCRSAVRTISLARAKLSSTSGTGLAPAAVRVASRVAADLAVGVGPQQRRHPEQLEVVERLEVGPVDHGGALGLQADRDARAGELRAVVGDECDVGGAADADHPVADALLLDARADLAQHLFVRDPADRLAQRAAEGRPDGDDDLVGRRRRAPRRPGRAAALGRRFASTRPTPAGSSSCGSACSSAQRSPSRR